MKFMIWEPSWEPEAEAELYTAPNLEEACQRWARHHHEWTDSTELDVSVRLEDRSVVSCVVSVEYLRAFTVAVGAAASAEEYEQGGGP